MCGLCTSRRIRATAPMCPAGSAGGPFEPADRPVVCMPHERGLVDASVRTSEAGLVLYFKSTGFDTLDRPSKLWGARLAPGGAALAGAPVHLLSQTAQWEARGGVGVGFSTGVSKLPSPTTGSLIKATTGYPTRQCGRLRSLITRLRKSTPPFRRAAVREL